MIESRLSLSPSCKNVSLLLIFEVRIITIVTIISLVMRIVIETHTKTIGSPSSIPSLIKSQRSITTDIISLKNPSYMDLKIKVQYANFRRFYFVLLTFHTILPILDS